MDDDLLRKMFSDGFFGGYERRRRQEETNDFGTFLRNDFERMFREMDELMRHFNPGSFRIIDDPNKLFSLPPPEAENDKRDNENEGKLRDQFLKPSEPASGEQAQLDVPRAKSIPFGGSSCLFDWLWTPSCSARKPRKEPVIDEDLDQKVATDGLDKVMREDLFKGAPAQELVPAEPRALQPRVFTSGQSVSIRRIQRADGSIEEIKTVRNSDGHEERTVTRIIGDKSHSVIEKKNGQGVQETEEIFKNFDENKLDDFNNMWSHFNKRKAAVEPDTSLNPEAGNEPRGAGPGASGGGFSIASKLFSWFK